MKQIPLSKAEETLRRIFYQLRRSISALSTIEHALDAVLAFYYNYGIVGIGNSKGADMLYMDSYFLTPDHANFPEEEIQISFIREVQLSDTPGHQTISVELVYEKEYFEQVEELIGMDPDIELRDYSELLNWKENVHDSLLFKHAKLQPVSYWEISMSSFDPLPPHLDKYQQKK